ncbi:Solute carrier family 2, facilitated glucose transporter member 3 [Echinococcus granulosus]|uniref:Solute carrier family 2, facilitated glucose transporter member 3 n=1 Tax=Echinococcus granulosus TaxID=6210 RepID=W6V9W9_ECHGR|nr:Solute carrier family 2, facilitated glucose transporter member 3 [Echinococcus granulosus]EUB63484.1 Solute carrier family 2, facilitated glucose transporter member 3 [Echinococcus granulosus]
MACVSTVTCTLVFATFVTCVSSSFMMGYNLGIVNLPAKYIEQFMVEKMSVLDKETLYALVSVVFIVGAAIGAFSCGFLADKLGRRNSLHMNTVIGLLGAILSGICVNIKNAVVLLVGRFISGLNAGVTIGVASMYLMEIAPTSTRGMIGACHQLAVTIGICLSYVVTLDFLLNTEDRWGYAILIGAIPCVTGLVLLPLCPESARYLFLIKKEEERAKEAYMKVSGAENANDFVKDMNDEAAATKSQPEFKVSYLFTKREYRKATAIAILIQVLQQLCGINAVIANSSTMLVTAKVKEDQMQYFVVGLGILNVVFTIIALPLLERAGRRTLLLWPTLLLGCCLLTQSIIVTIGRSKPEEEQAPFAIVAVSMVYIYLACFAVGLGPIPAMIVAEIFRQGPRTAAYSVSQGVQWLCNLMKAMAGFVYLPFLVVVVICWCFFFFVMPETKNKSFDEIAKILSGEPRSNANGGNSNVNANSNLTPKGITQAEEGNTL